MRKSILPIGFIEQKSMCGLMDKPLKTTGDRHIGMMHKAGYVEALG